jgi:hypothetical protein
MVVIMWRKTAILSVAALAALTPGQDAGTKITYTTVAVPIHRALEELGQKTGVSLLAAPQTASEIVVIHAVDVPLSVLMQRIARAVSGEWRQEGDAYRLAADPSLRTREERTELQARAQEIRKRLQDHFQPQTGRGNPAVGVTGGPPVRVTLSRLLMSIDANQLAAIPRGGRVVFATTPNRMQRALPSGAAGTIQALVAEHNKWVDAQPAREVATDAEVPPALRTMMERLQPRNKRIESPPTKALLAASRSPMMGWRYSLSLYDAQGNTVLNHEEMVFEGDMFGIPMDDIMEQMSGGATQAPKQEEDPRPIDLGPETKEFLAIMRGAMMPGGIGSVQMSEGFRAKLTAPHQYDPLSYLASDLVLGVAKAKGVSTVAVLPDDMALGPAAAMMTSDATVSSALTALSSGRNTVATVEDGWLLVRPARPAEARNTRLNRVALAELLMAAQSKDVPSLDDLAAFARRAPSPFEAPASLGYLMFFAPSAVSSGFGMPANWEMLRLYGTLSPSLKQSMAAGQAVPFGSMTGEQRAIATRLLYGSEASLRIADQGPRDPMMGMFGMFERMMPGGSSDFRTEATEAMPTGLPAQGTLSLQIKSTPVVKPEGAPNAITSMFGVLGADELALFEHFREDPSMGMVSSFLPTFDKLKVGRRTIYEFTFAVAQGVVETQALNDSSFGPGAPIVSMSGIPQELAALVKERREVIKKSPFGQLGGMMGGLGTPPRQRPPHP